MGSFNFLGKERVRYPITDERSSLAVFAFLSKRENMTVRPLPSIHKSNGRNRSHYYQEIGIIDFSLNDFKDRSERYGPMFL